MNLKQKIDALKEAAGTNDLPATTRFNPKTPLIKEVPFGPQLKTPEERQKEIQEHLEQRTSPTKKVRPRPPTQTERREIMQAQQNKEKLKQLFAEEEDVIEDFKKIKDLDYKKGFSYDPRNKKIVTDREAREKYGKPGISMHYIPVTDNPGDVENLREKWKEIHSKKEAKEKPPHFIGGWQDEKGKKFTDISYILNSNDPEEVQKHLQQTNQRYTYSVHPDMSTEYIKNKKYKEKTAQEVDLETQQPLHVLLQGKRYANMGKLDIGNLNYDEADILKDKNIISVILVNDSESELYKFGLDTNMSKDAYKINFPYKISQKERGVATLFLMGSKINSMPKDEPIRLKFTYKEKSE